MVTDKSYIAVTVECSRCKVQQKIHIAARTEFAQLAGERVRWINCDHSFKVTVADKIIGGPFPE
jgi:hypothetical protein